MEKLTNAFLLLSKPYGITSRKFLNEVGKVLGEDKVGHTGTLDPMATGLLFVAVGQFTRLIPYVKLDTKEYFIEITFGIETDTWDITGKQLKLVEPNVKEEDILKVLPQFVGDVTQRVPFFSAKKFKGVELYKLARKEILVEAFKPTRIDGIEYIRFKNNKLILRVSCEKGTYMRSLAYEIGLALGVPATLSAISRTKIGDLTIKDATTLSRLKKGDFSKGFIAPEVVIPLEAVIIRDGGSFMRGVKTEINTVLVFDENKNFIGIAELKGELKPKVIINGNH